MISGEIRIGFIFFFLLSYILKYFKNVYLSIRIIYDFFQLKKSYLEHNSLIVLPAESFHTQH